MKKVPNASWKHNRLQDIRTAPYCDKKKCIPLAYSRLTFHHRLKDDKGNRQNFPLFIHSILNLDSLPLSCHPNCDRITLTHYTPEQAREFEKFLENNLDIAYFLNGEKETCCKYISSEYPDYVISRVKECLK